MTIEALINDLAHLDDAVGICLQKKHILPALVLLYAGIDIVASLECQLSDGTKASFVRWVERYLLPAKPMGCTALELYSARCAILHTYTADSDLSKRGQARKVYYAWGTASSGSLQESARRLDKTDVVALHVDDIRDAFCSGTAAWLSEVVKDPIRRRKVEAVSRGWFTYMSTPIVDDFLQP
jgi:hypothetical protein